MTPQDANRRTEAVCRLAPIVPVLVVEDVAQAVPLAEALVAGGLPALEVTLRTPAALEAKASVAISSVSPSPSASSSAVSDSMR